MSTTEQTATTTETPKPITSVFAAINRPYGGARTQHDLPKGSKPIQLYTTVTPNGHKIGIALEEMGLEYDTHTIALLEGDQFTSGLTEINPNQKVPALVDYDGPQHKRVNVFESGSILLYLATKTGKLIPAAGTPEYVECLNWLFFQHGSLGPYFGQYAHFNRFASEKIPYAIDRYTMEAKRLLDVIDKQLEGKQYIVGDQYTIADIAIFSWTHIYDEKIRAYLSTAFGREDKYANIDAWLERIRARPAVQKGLKVSTGDSCIGADKGPVIASTK